MMRRFYRNRHATFIKTLLDQKNKKQEAEEEQKAKEEKRRKKLRDKVHANMHRKDELPPIEGLDTNGDTGMNKTNSSMFNSTLMNSEK